LMSKGTSRNNLDRPSKKKTKKKQKGEPSGEGKRGKGYLDPTSPAARNPKVLPHRRSSARRRNKKRLTSSKVILNKTVRPRPPSEVEENGGLMRGGGEGKLSIRALEKKAPPLWASEGRVERLEKSGARSSAETRGSCYSGGWLWIAKLAKKRGPGRATERECGLKKEPLLKEKVKILRQAVS